MTTLIPADGRTAQAVFNVLGAYPPPGVRRDIKTMGDKTIVFHNKAPVEISGEQQKQFKEELRRLTLSEEGGGSVLNWAGR